MQKASETDIVFFEYIKYFAKSLFAIFSPYITANKTRITPIIDASVIFCGLIFLYIPTNIAIGIVAAIVNVPQALSLKAFTTPIASPARAVIIIKKTAIPVDVPTSFPASFLQSL